MTLKFDFQQNEVSFFFFLSHLSALSCIAGVHHIIKFLAAEQFAQNIELRLLCIMYQQFPLGRENRQIFKAPVFIAFIVMFRGCILCQMPQTPAYHAITRYFKFFPPSQKAGIAFRLPLHPYVTVFYVSFSLSCWLSSFTVVRLWSVSRFSLCGVSSFGFGL